jgi:hypothetical protein
MAPTINLPYPNRRGKANGEWPSQLRSRIAFLPKGNRRDAETTETDAEKKSILLNGLGVFLGVLGGSAVAFQTSR